MLKISPQLIHKILAVFGSIESMKGLTVGDIMGISQELRTLQPVLNQAAPSPAEGKEAVKAAVKKVIEQDKAAK